MAYTPPVLQRTPYAAAPSTSAPPRESDANPFPEVRILNNPDPTSRVFL
jgi:hypothetical protein